MPVIDRYLFNNDLVPEFLYERMQLAYRRGAASVLLACAPDYTGKFRHEDVEQLMKLGRMLRDPTLAQLPSLTTRCPVNASSVRDAGCAADKAVDGDPATRWGAAKGATNGWLEMDLGAPAHLIATFPTGEADAGESPVRFGGRGARTGSRAQKRNRKARRTAPLHPSGRDAMVQFGRSPW